jgi:hypothetical protein
LFIKKTKKKLMNFTYIDISTIVLSTIFFYCLFNGYLSINNINNLLNSYPLIGAFFKLLGIVLLICLVIYFFTDVAYAMAPDSAGNNLPKPDVKVTTGDVNNSVTIKDSTINIPNVVAIGLTNLGSGAAIAAGLKGGASIAKVSGFSPTAKLGAMVVGGLSAGTIVLGTNAANSIFQKKVDSAVVNSAQSNTTPTTSEGGGGSAAFSIEPSADIDTVMALLNSAFILDFCILYFIFAFVVIYISNKVVENK